MDDGAALVLEADGRQLSTAPERLGRLKPTPFSAGLDAIQHFYRENGYVWIKGLLDAGEVNEFRGWVFHNLAQSGLLRPGSDPHEGIGNPLGHDRALATRRLMMLVRSARFEQFCLQPRLSRFMDDFLNGISYLHKRKIMRYTLPASRVATPAHYDLVYLRGGTDRIVTAWIPIGDISVAEGGLVYLKGSHLQGRSLEADFSERAKALSPEERTSAFNKHMTEGGYVSKNLPEMAERFDTQWLIADYEAGDVVLHDPYFIHASTNNESATGRIRLSTDIRYQNVEDEIDARWSQHWSLDDML
jgi:ectoine hydroxylase-related dioxygenase (phytanoyl-CoA dioxygenase family)